MSVETSLDPLTGEPVHTRPVSTDVDLALAVLAAETAAPTLAASSPADRAGWLRAAADAVDRHAEELAALADRETRLGRARLDGEVARCAAQLRFYADVAVEGGFLDAVIDHAAGAQPDLRRQRVPLGPVAVFGASNFPFAFGSVGNDTAAALAAGCPVVVKAHPAHLGTHQALMDVVIPALESAGAPEGTLGAVTGFGAGTSLVVHPGITAVGFTGSQQGGMALLRAAATRAVAIPVFAEMGTVNPVVLTSGAAARVEEIATGCVGSYTLGMGQFCTKPGLVLTPAGSGLTEQLVVALQRATPRGPLLTDAIAGSYAVGVDQLIQAGAQLVSHVAEPGPGSSVSAVVMTADLDLLQPGSPVLAECFGPVVIVSEYPDTASRDAALTRLQGCLVASVMTGGPDDPEVAGLVTELTGLAGRVVVDGWPTGVATSWAQHHGGPWPSTSAPAATSVGAAGLDRFTRPVAYQSVPAHALPPALRDDNPWRLPRRVDGVVIAAPTGTIATTGPSGAAGSRSGESS